MCEEPGEGVSGWRGLWTESPVRLRLRLRLRLVVRWCGGAGTLSWRGWCGGRIFCAFCVMGGVRLMGGARREIQLVL